MVVRIAGLFIWTTESYFTNIFFMHMCILIIQMCN